MATKPVTRTIGTILLRTILLANTIAVGLLWACCATTWLTPAEHPKLALTGLLFPAFLLCVVLFIIVWVILKPKWCFLSIVGLIVCFPYILDYCPMTIQKNIPAGSIKLLSWNCNGFAVNNQEADITPEMFVEYLREADADIYSLQESSSSNEHILAFIDEMKEMGYTYDNQQGHTLLSRFPIARTQLLDYDETDSITTYTNGSVCYWLLDDQDTILLINNHLESNGLSPDIKTKYANSLTEHNIDSLEQYGRTMGSIIKNKTASRGLQTDALTQFIEANSQYPTICCGDMNDTPISYVYQQLSKRLKNAYRESGRGIGISYNEKGFWVRIDHIFVSEHFDSYKTFVDNSQALSDHYPIITWLKRK